MVQDDSFAHLMIRLRERDEAATTQVFRRLLRRLIVLAPDDLSTRLRWSVRIGLPLRYRMFESMVTPQARRAATLDLEALKRRLESVAGH
jgi:hypothetical protein